MPSNNLPRDVFLYLLAIITLIVSAVSFGIIVFQYINIYIPDIVSDPYSSPSNYYSSLRYSLATLMVVFPVFVWVSWFLRRDINKHPEKKELKIRKWLIYLTLFAAALLIIGDLVALLRGFLEGELSQRFVLKVLAILFIAGSILVHYLSELKDKIKDWVRFFDWGVMGVVLVSIIMGFVVAGSPQNQRLVRLDEQRVSHLQTIQWQIVNYWQRKQALPAKLEELNDPIGGFTVPRDPETGALYDYSVMSKFKFELCATFSTVSLENRSDATTKPVPVMEPGYPESQGVWWHGEGRVCFERTIDPELYPPLTSIKPRPL